MNTEEQRLRAASWREIADRPIDRDTVLDRDVARLMVDALNVVYEGITLLPLIELAEELLVFYTSNLDAGLSHWRNVLPIVTVARLDAIRESRGN